MKTHFQVLSQEEIEWVHTASMSIPAEVGIKVSYNTARELFKQAGAQGDEETFAVKIPEQLVR